MQTVILGRTNIEVSVVGLGCGGHSRLGLAHGKSEAHAVRIVSHALELGVNFIDTARAYKTESAVGNAIKGKRDQVVISTKSSAGRGAQLMSAADVVESLELSLGRLQTDYIDVFNLHGVTIDQYPHCVDELIPALLEQKRKGKIRYLGITEQFISDPSHKMLQVALPDDFFDVVMVGFNILNPSARKTVFPLTIEKNVGTQIMFAVRRALSQPEALCEIVEKLVAAGDVQESVLDLANPLGFLEIHPKINSVVEAAYRLCRYEPGATVVLTGTGSEGHLTQNIESILAPELPADIREKLEMIFGEVDSVSGN
jgi:aryl-alcohol dehydrogenase-like predicted oxidoreductase